MSTELLAGVVLLIGLVLLLAAGCLGIWRLHGHWRTQEGVEGATGTSRPTTASDSSGTADTAASDGAILTAPDGSVGPRVGVIPGWRCWRLDATYEAKELLLRLVSQTRLDYWDGPVKAADVEPTPENDSGLYAAKEWQSPILPCHTDRGDMRVLGRVGLYGTVVEGDRGYRAARAVIEELWLLDAQVYIRAFGSKQAAMPMELIEADLAERYQVEVHRGWPDGKLQRRLFAWMER